MVGEVPTEFALPKADGYYSREAFRRWYEAQPKGRYERVDGRIVAMAPERGAHLRVKGAIYRALDRAVALAGVPCQALPDCFVASAPRNDGTEGWEESAIQAAGMRRLSKATPKPQLLAALDYLIASPAVAVGLCLRFSLHSSALCEWAEAHP